MADKRRVIIVATGLSSRLREYTAGKPKCLLEVGNKTLPQRQLESYSANGNFYIHLVRDYKKEKISYEGITFATASGAGFARQIQF